MPKNKSEGRENTAAVMGKKKPDEIRVIDGLLKMRLILERAEIVMQDVVEDYFEAYDPQSEDGNLSIAWEYDRHRIKADIVQDYLRDQISQGRLPSRCGTGLGGAVYCGCVSSRIRAVSRL